MTTKFVYKARDKSGVLILGEVDGTSASSVKEALASKGLFPVSVQVKGLEFSFKTLMRKKPNLKDIANLTRQFQVMFKAGTPMDRILATLVRQAKEDGLKEALTQIQKDVAGGMRLALAFGRHPQYFNSLYTSMLAVGETGGVLDKILKELSSILQKEYQIQSHIKSATLYPKLVLGISVLVTWGMLVFVVPVFQNFYSQHGAKLPLPAQILLNISQLIKTHWYIPILLIGLMVYGWKSFSQSDQGKRWVGRLSFRLPVFGKLNLLIANARFGHLVSALYRAGFPLAQTLTVVADTMTNICYAEELRSVKKGLEQGRLLSQGMRDTRYFEPMIQETTAVGEQTGKLDEMLESTALFYDEEIDYILKNMTTLIEPLLLFFLFGLIALLALAVYLPVLNLSKVILPS